VLQARPFLGRIAGAGVAMGVMLAAGAVLVPRIQPVWLYLAAIGAWQAISSVSSRTVTAWGFATMALAFSIEPGRCYRFICGDHSGRPDRRTRRARQSGRYGDIWPRGIEPIVTL
jgi:hypothetical protein